jgi:hypothetical protein
VHVSGYDWFQWKPRHLGINESIIEQRVLEVSMNSTVTEAESRRARRVTQLGRVLFVCDFRFRGVADLQDLSTTGCRVVSESPLQVGMELELSLCVASNERDIEIEQAKVRWANGQCFGLEFVAICPLERERLRLYLKTVVVGAAVPLT